MKNLAVKIIGCAMGLFLITGTSYAQDPDPATTQTREQKREMKKNQNAVNQQNRERFRASLTEDQVAILENQEMNRHEKRKAFRASLTEQQNEMLREKKEIRKQQRNEYRNCATNEQRQQRQQNRENVQNQTRTGQQR